MPRNLQLQVMLDTIDRVTRPLRQITRGTRGATEALRETRDQLRTLENAQKNLQGFTRLRRQSEGTAASLNEQQQRIRELTRRIDTAEGSTRQLTRQRNAAIRQARTLTAQYDREQQRLRELRGRLRQVDGVTGSLSEQQRELARRIEAANRRLERQRSALERLGGARVGERFQTMTTSIGRFTRQAALMGTVAGGGLFALANSTATLGDGVAKTADQIGIALGPFQELRYAAERSGVSTEKFDSSLERFIKRIGEASLGTGAARKAYEELGLSAEALSRLTPEKSLSLVADRLATVEDHTQRVAFAAQLFGREGVAMVNLLRDGSDGLEDLRRQARLTGYVLSDQAARDAEVFKDRLLDAQLGLQGMKNVLGAELMPAISELMRNFSEWMLENRDRVNAFARTFAERFTDAIPSIVNLGKGLMSMASTIGRITSVLANMVGGFDNLGVVMATLFALKPVIAFASFAKAIWGFGAGLASLIATLPAVSAGFATLSAALAATPIGWMIAGIAAVAGIGYLLYKNWSSIGDFFQGLWVDIKAAFSDGLAGVNRFLSNWDPLTLFYRSFAGVLGAFGVELPATFTEFGATLIAGFNRGLATAFDGAKTILLGTTDRIVGLGSTISGFFMGLWGEVRQAFSGGIAGVGELIRRWSPVNLFYQAFSGVLDWFGVELPDTFTEFGSLILSGLKNGILGAFNSLKDTVLNAGESVIGWFKDTLGIHSPSRVFAELGSDTLDGFQSGLKQAERGTLRQLRGVTDRIVRAGAGIALGGTMATQVAALPALSMGGAITPPATAIADLPRIGVDIPDIDRVALDTRGPLPATPGQITVQGDNITLNVYPSAGMDERALAAYIERLLDERDQRKAVCLRSALHDLD